MKMMRGISVGRLAAIGCLIGGLALLVVRGATPVKALVPPDDCDKFASFRTTLVTIDNQTGKKILNATATLHSDLALDKPYLQDAGPFQVCANTPAGSPCQVDACRAKSGATQVILATKAVGQVQLQNPDGSTTTVTLPTLEPTPPATNLPTVTWSIH